MLVAIALMGLVSSSSGVERQQTIKSPANGTADRIALLVANANYPDAEAPLPYIRADESALADALRQKGYDVEFVADATREQLLQAVNTAEAKMRPGSTVVLSFAGYAVQSQEQNYLLPVDAKIWTERDVRVQGFSVDELLSELEHTGARERIALLDASYRNPFERRFRSYSHGLAPMLNGQNQVMESSVPPDEVVDAEYHLSLHCSVHAGGSGNSGRPARDHALVACRGTWQAIPQDHRRNGPDIHCRRTRVDVGWDDGWH
jgi:hypothetical protein